jgi:orotidine-5'-phosphate decarboxylase
MLPNAPLLIPGYGAQGASANDATAALVPDLTIPSLKNFGLINASRSITFPTKSYQANNIEEWQSIIRSEIRKTNKELISAN